MFTVDKHSHVFMYKYNFGLENKTWTIQKGMQALHKSTPKMSTYKKWKMELKPSNIARLSPTMTPSLLTAKRANRCKSLRKHWQLCSLTKGVYFVMLWNGLTLMARYVNLCMSMYNMQINMGENTMRCVSSCYGLCVMQIMSSTMCHVF